MGVAFSEDEKIVIKGRLVEAAKICLQKYGVKKTTVDQLVQMAGISKGSFYSFYQSKEILFFKTLEEYQISLISALNDRFTQKEKIGVEEFTELFYELYQEVRRSFLMNIIEQQEFEYLMRRLPKELVIEHHSLDDMFAEKILSNIQMRDNMDIHAVSAALRAVFLSMVFAREIGEKDFDEALRLLIRGLALQIIQEG